MDKDKEENEAGTCNPSEHGTFSAKQIERLTASRSKLAEHASIRDMNLLVLRFQNKGGGGAQDSILVLIHNKQLHAALGSGAVGFGVVGDDVGFAGAEGEAATVLEFGRHLAGEHVEDVSADAPVVGFVSGRVFHAADAQVALLHRPPDRFARVAVVFGGRNRGPVDGGEGDVFDAHGGIVSERVKNIRG